MPSADQVPVNSSHSTMRWHEWVVLTAGSTGSALRAVRPPNLHITPVVRRDLVYAASATGSLYRSPLAIIAQTIRVAPGSVTSALEPLRMARKLDPYRETARMALEPWLVEAALARLSQQLSPTDQRIVVKATRTPHKVRWPEWWTENP